MRIFRQLEHFPSQGFYSSNYCYLLSLMRYIKWAALPLQLIDVKHAEDVTGITNHIDLITCNGEVQAQQLTSAKLLHNILEVISFGIQILE